MLPAIVYVSMRNILIFKHYKCLVFYTNWHCPIQKLLQIPLNNRVPTKSDLYCITTTILLKQFRVLGWVNPIWEVCFLSVFLGSFSAGPQTFSCCLIFLFLTFWFIRHVHGPDLNGHKRNPIAAIKLSSWIWSIYEMES